MGNLAVEKSLYCTFLCYLRSFSGLKDVHFSFSNHLKNGASIDMLKRVGQALYCAVLARNQLTKRKKMHV
jgi:hypothetical protein